jgi:hypothetical protein
MKITPRSILFASSLLVLTACVPACSSVNPTIQGLAATIEGIANKVDSIGVQVANGAAKLAGTNAVPVLSPEHKP